MFGLIPQLYANPKRLKSSSGNSVRADSDHAGYVVGFDVADDVGERYPAQTAGASALHRELWVPAEELETFNDVILGAIRVTATYRAGVRVET